MRTAILAAALVVSPVGIASADECAGRVANLVLESLNVKPSRGLMDVEIVGGQKTQNEFLMAAADHTLSRPIVPPNQPWTLTYKGGMYQSSDEGSTWKKVHSFNSEESRQSR